MPRNGMVVLRGVPDEGLEIELGGSAGPIALTVLDITRGLPPPDVAPLAHDVLRARDARAVPTQEGDITILSRRFDL